MFAYANGVAVEPRNQSKSLEQKMFAPANAAFACANPSRGDVSPLLPARQRRRPPWDSVNRQEPVGSARFDRADESFWPNSGIAASEEFPYSDQKPSN